MASEELKASEIISGVPELASELNKLHQSVKDMLTVLKQGVSTFEKQSKSQDDLAKKTKATKEATGKLTALEKERIRIAEQSKKVLAQNLALNEKGAKVLLKGNLALKARKAALLEEITGAKAAAADRKSVV